MGRDFHFEPGVRYKVKKSDYEWLDSQGYVWH
jgi:hypothetical protein